MIYTSVLCLSYRVIDVFLFSQDKVEIWEIWMSTQISSILTQLTMRIKESMKFQRQSSKVDDRMQRDAGRKRFRICSRELEKNLGFWNKLEFWISHSGKSYVYFLANHLQSLAEKEKAKKLYV